jgi:hypothetical protein
VAAPDVDVGRGQACDAFMISAIVVMVDEGSDLGFEVF